MKNNCIITEMWKNFLECRVDHCGLNLLCGILKLLLLMIHISLAVADRILLLIFSTIVVYSVIRFIIVVMIHKSGSGKHCQ